MKHLSRNELEEIGERVIRAYRKLPELKDQPVYRIYPELLVGSLLGLRMEYRHLSADRSILGLTSFESIGVTLPGNENAEEFYLLDGKTILIESDLREDIEQTGRRNFTIAHEASHQVLKMLFPAEYGGKSYEALCFRKAVGAKPVSDWEEWQSNVLGAAMLLSRYLVERAMCLFGLRGNCRIPNKALVRDEYNRFVGMTQLLGCSKTALAIRMEQFGYVEPDYLKNLHKILYSEVE